MSHQSFPQINWRVKMCDMVYSAIYWLIYFLILCACVRAYVCMCVCVSLSIIHCQIKLPPACIYYLYTYILTCILVYLIGHSPLGLFRTNTNKQWYLKNGFSSEHNKVKNPSWQEGDHLQAIYKRSSEVELGATENNITLEVRTGFEPATYGFQIRRSNHLATLPCILLCFSDN